VLLGQDVAIEPLVDGWPAWLMLLDPVTAGFYRRRHVELLTSYLSSPERHAKALRDPRLTGGSFCDLAPVPAGKVAAYLEWYAESSREYLRFAHDLEQVRRTLMDSDPASPLPDYLHLPASLRGRIEFRYDYLGRPSLRLLAGAAAVPRVTGSAIWANASQRPAIFSNPRLADDPRAQSVAMSAEETSMRSAMHHREVALVDFERCARRAGLRDPHRLVDGATRQAGKDRRIRFLGHASVAIPLPSGLLVSDPVPPSCNPAARGLGDVRLILISHGHPDHFSPEALLSLLPMGPTVIVPASGSGTPYDPALKSAVAALGFEDVVELRPYESLVRDDVTVRALPFLGEHGSLAIDSKAVFEVRQEQRSVILAADATGLDPQVLVSCADAASNVCLVIGIESAGARSGWLYGPLLGKSPAGLRLANEPLAGADAAEVMALAEASGAQVIRIYGTGAPGLGHVLGRSSLNASRADAEARKLRAMRSAKDLDIRVLTMPGEEVIGGTRP
jgi:hypothetical protein